MKAMHLTAYTQMAGEALVERFAKRTQDREPMAGQKGFQGRRMDQALGGAWEQ